MSATRMSSGDLEDLSPREVRALREPMRVVDDDPETWGPHEVMVYSEDRKHLVNTDVKHCDCGDAAYRRVTCKHIYRAKFALGEREIPEWVEMDSVDDQLRQRLEDQ